MAANSMTDQLLVELHQCERRLSIPSLTEAIRLLESQKFHQLTGEQIREVGEYRAIEIDGEWFFDKAFTTGKEVSASLGYAKHLGREVVLDDLVRLRATLSGPARLSPEPPASADDATSHPP